jgi:hypothetical protein
MNFLSDCRDYIKRCCFFLRQRGKQGDIHLFAAGHETQEFRHNLIVHVTGYLHADHKFLYYFYNFFSGDFLS